ncbi:hypothetical protein EDI28_26290 [Photobacterium chitinilyticum]|uniref:Uncharacterized protein n=1 Tax=Photobacterium chitinilyticum TaxID=2485123 RepID=A0A444JHU2_9GAMM|nr:hypothetical protein EDI28_26290 [Photobacterium chitinilyticum]
MRCSSQSNLYQVVIQVGLAQGFESKSELLESALVVCMPQSHQAWKDYRPSMLAVMDGVA